MKVNPLSLTSTRLICTIVCSLSFFACDSEDDSQTPTGGEMQAG